MLKKGFEIELYTGTSNGDIVGLSDYITSHVDGYELEPDSRNVEYITSPCLKYEQGLCDIIEPRIKLRKFLQQKDYTVVPGSALSLGDSKKFYRSKPDDPYHDFIEKTYGSRIVTASIHINLGIDDPETLIRICRLIRVEAPLYLALSASSPFLDDTATGYHSTRWMLFPKTHAYVPLFQNHQHFIDWMEYQLKIKGMQNVRHLWTSVRPNGSRRPYDLNRLELRICDFPSDPMAILAITALLESRILQAIEDSSLDPLQSSYIKNANQLLWLISNNEQAASKNSLEAKLMHWQRKEDITAAEWIEEIYDETFAFANKNGFADFLMPVKQIIEKGNEAQKWLQLHKKGMTIREIMSQAIIDIRERETELTQAACQ